MSVTTFLFLTLLVLTFAQKDPHFPPGRSTIVHLFEWKWSDVALECERFLQVKGFGGVQISPPNENLILTDPSRPWYERYQPISYKIETRSGDESDFLDMTKRCNAVGVRIIADTVINHMTSGSGTGTAGSTADRATKNFPAVPFTSSDFHETCDVNNFQDPVNVRNCELAQLADLDQGQEYVRNKIIDYMNHLIDLGVAGFRIDAAKHIWPEDLSYIFSHLKDLSTDHGFVPGSRPFFTQEVPDYGTDAISKYEYTDIGTITEFQYGVFLGNMFQGGNQLSKLENWGSEWGLVDSPSCLAFIDNHDTQRNGGAQILTYKNAKPYKMAVAFMLAHPYGIPRIMSSYDFSEYSQGPPHDNKNNIISPGINNDGTCTNGWVCEHRWREIFNMVVFRNVAKGTKLENWWSNGDQQIAFSRENKGFVAFTNGGDINERLQTGLPAGTYCDVISGDVIDGGCTGRTITVGDDGIADVHLGFEDFDGVLAIHVNATVINSSIN